MSNNYLKGMIKTSLSLSLMSMAGMVISPALSDIGTYFSNIPSVYIQMLITVPSLCMIPSSLISTKIKDHFRYKQIYLCSLLILLICGIVPMFIKEFIIIFICRIFIGLSIGLLTPINTSMITTYLSDDHKTKILGLNTAMESIGGAFMVIASGFLASISWELCFIVYLVACIPLAIVLFDFDDQFQRKEQTPISQYKIDKNIIIYTLILCIYMTFLNVFSTNISALILEKEIGSTVLSGVVVALYLMSGFICGLLFEKINHLFKTHTFLAGMFLCAVGLMVLYLAHNKIGIFIGSVISGYGMGQAIPASLNIASRLSNKETQTFHISIFLSGSRIGQFLTTLFYIPLLHALNLNVIESYFISSLCLLVLCFLTFVFEKGMMRE